MMQFGFLKRTLIRMGLPLIRLAAVTPKKGAQTSIYLAIAPELESVSGKFFK